MGRPAGRDFFISYTAVDRAWAEWIAVQLEQDNYTTVLQAWDFRPGSDFTHEMQAAAFTAARMIAVLSPAYFGSEFSEAEWRAAFTKDPTGRLGLLIPVRVQPCEPPGLLASRVFVDLVGVVETTARRLLLDGVNKAWERPTSRPYPGAAVGSNWAPPKPYPGLSLEVGNLPARNRNFSSREGVLFSSMRLPRWWLPSSPHWQRTGALAAIIALPLAVTMIFVAILGTPANQSGDPSQATSLPPAPPPTTAPTTTSVDTVGDTRLAQEITFTSADVPGSWSASRCQVSGTVWVFPAACRL